MNVFIEKKSLIVRLFQWLLFGLTILLSPLEVLAQRPDSTNVAQDTLSNQPYSPSRRPTFRPRDRYGDPFSNTTTESPLFLKDPAQMKLDVEIDTAGNYTIYEKIGDLNYRPTSSMSLEEFKQHQDRQILKNYWQSRSKAQDGESPVTGRGLIPKIFISPVLDRIFGGSYVELIPRGFVTLDFGAQFQKSNSPGLSIRQQRNGGFEFDQQINMSVVGKVGEKLAVTANFDNNNSFDFQNNMKVEYTGFKEDILQKLEIGNVSLPLNNTLIQGAQNLFGVKAQLQFGKLNVTSIATTQRGKTSSIDIAGGGGPGGTGQGTPFQLIASQYDENRHFFLSHFFRDNYNHWIKGTPMITSGVYITRVEVYVLNRANETTTLRNVVGFMDLGERSKRHRTTIALNGGAENIPPSNETNTLWAAIQGMGSRDVDNITSRLESLGLGLESGTDFEKINGARRLSDTEFTFHRQLGYITLSRKLQNDEAIAVAFEYTYKGANYKVGELTEDYGKEAGDQAIFLKLLRQRNLSTYLKTPNWNLMMKNVYSITGGQISQEGFQLRIIYRDDATGIDNPHFQEPAFKDRQLVTVFGLDRLNAANDQTPEGDGNFDYVEGITVNSQHGLIIFPHLEPFGDDPRGPLAQLFNNDPGLVQKYSYDTLYRATKADAELFATKNKFWLRGFYTGSGGTSKEIMIPGFGVAQGSVKLFAGGTPMIEGTDYVVDYTFGKITILNDAILNSGKDIEVKYEQNDPFAFQTRSLLGSRFDYRLNEDVNFGGTFLYYNERPLVTRNQIGTEPARNMQYGLDFNINKKSRLLTKMVDALPFLETKEPSSINVTGEFAQLLPGTSNVIDGESTAYIDDFESTATPYSLMNPLSWKLGAIPRSEENFYEGTGLTERAKGYRRAKLAWYTIDNQLQRDEGQYRPDNITDEDLKNHWVRTVLPDEIFPYKQFQQAVYQETIFDLAYYPYERGPYNYNPDLDNNGRLRGNLRRNWAAITNAVRTEVDFDKANIEYIEFWLLDPFLEGNYSQINDGFFNGRNQTGGKLIFQLGDLSEDVIPDGKHAFENGLPANTADLQDPKKATKNVWGYVTEQQYLTNGFDNTSNGRGAQDVGFDGVASSLEEGTFVDYLQEVEAVNPQAVNAIRSDISADDYRHFLDASYDGIDAKVLQRYKNYNGMDGNTPASSGSENYTRASYQNPDNEDINADNTLNESDAEQYYEFDIDIRPGQLQVGRQYIVDKQVAKAKANGEEVTWYLFRIPVRNPENTYGDMSGFKSIRYMRTILTDFDQPIVLRMANFRMVGSRWRRYTKILNEDGISEAPAEQVVEDVTVSVVNLEENSEGDTTGTKSAYVIPPGVIRDRDNTSSVSRLLNEQSIQMCVDELKDGEGRAIYKNLVVDLFNYKKLRMFFHANAETFTDDDDLRAFVRLGTDFDQNYYEIEIPLKISRDLRSTVEREVWPEENEINVALEKLYQLKAKRDREGVPIFSRYPQSPDVAEGTDGHHKLTIFGRPDLTSVQVVMIGVRNPSTPDRQRHSVCIWANELRATGFDRSAGWAVSSTVNAKLADFATLTGAIRHTTFGFGGVSSKIFERTRDETTAYDVTANVNVDKLIPGNHGIKIPMYLSYENTRITPQYDPANPDMRTNVMLGSFADGEGSQRERYLRLIQDRTTQRSLNFTNVRKIKVNPDSPSRLWDIENFSFSYAYSEQIRTSFATALSEQKRQGGSVAYQFSPTAAGIEPFKNVKAFSSPWLKFIQEFNFNLMPSSLAVRLDLERSFSKLIYRSALGDGDFAESTPNYLKYFFFNRNYNLRWDLTKSLSLEYNAVTNAIVDEPFGELDSREKRDSVMTNLKKFGRVKNFDQNVTVNYKLPFEMFPVTDWVGADYRYQVNYNWRAGAINVHDSLNFRNTISNSREQNYSAKLDLVKLYNKVKFLKELNTPPRPTNARVNPRARIQQDTTQQQREVPSFVKGFFRLLMSVKSINGTYTLGEGTILPGFDRTPSLFGMEKWGAPGVKFVLGDQDPEFRKRAALNGWLTNKEDLSTQFMQNKIENVSLRANVEPARDLKIQIDVKKETMTSYAETFRFDSATFNAGEGYNGFNSFNPSRSGSYRISINTIKTAFNGTNDELESEVFLKFQENLGLVQSRFNAEGTYEYDSAQDILIPAFLAAYTDKNAATIGLSPFPKTPMPNWRVDYTGLSRVGFFKDVLQSITISHAYQSMYSVSNYSNSLQYSNKRYLEIDRDIAGYNDRYFGDQPINPEETDPALQRTLPVYIISQVLISEQFSPLIGINVRTKSRVTANLQYKTKRDVALNISNAQVTELSSKDVSFELGFTKNNMKLPFKSQGRTIVLKNDVTFRMNATVGDTRTIQRKIDELNVITNGNVNFQLRPNVSYTVNQKLTVQLYFERTINEPLISTSARRTQTRFGAQIRFSLAQ